MAEDSGLADLSSMDDAKAVVEQTHKIKNESISISLEDELKELQESQGNLSEPEFLQKAVHIYEKNGKHSDALLKAIELILCLYEIKSRSEDIEEFSHWENAVVRNGKALARLSNTIDDQDILTQLYILGGCLQRNKEYSLASYVFKVAVLTYEQTTDGAETALCNNILAMKMLFQTAQCQKSLGSIDQCITHLQLSLSLSLQNNDVTFEVKILYELANALLDEKIYDKAVAYFLLLKNAKEDILHTISNSKNSTMEINDVLPADIDELILLSLVRGYIALRLYSDALIYSKMYKELVSSSDHSKLIVVNDMLTQIYSSLGKFQEALECVQDTLKTLLPPVKTSIVEQDRVTLIDTANCFKTEGEVLMKMKHHKEANFSFQMVNEIGRVIRDDILTTTSLLLLSKSSLASNQIELSRQCFKQALQLSEDMGNDRMELKCFLVESEIFAKERKYSYALYQAERGLALAARKDDKDMMQLFRVQVGKFSQHSTSEKELSCGVLILLVEIADLEHAVHFDRSDGVLDDSVASEIDSLYTAVEVCLHRLNENKLSLIIAECRRRRLLNQLTNQKPQLPVFHLNKEFTWNNIADRKSLCFLDPDDFLQNVKDCVLLSYSLCECGFLAHLSMPGLKVVKSYLLSSSAVKPLNIIRRIKQLISTCRGQFEESAESSMCDMYNTELRTFPRNSQSGDIRSFANSAAVDDDDVGNLEDTITGIMTGDEFNGSNETVEQALQQLYTILVKPFASEINELSAQTSICIIADSFLNKIPFDQLITDDDLSKPFGEQFNISMCFSTQQLHCREDAVPTEPPKLQSARENRLVQCVEKLDDFHSLHATKLDKQLDGLITSTATGTHIMTSSRYQTQYMQKCTLLRCCVIGAPRLNKSLQLDGRVWKPKAFLPQAHAECESVGEYLDVTPAIGIDATKHRFLYELSNSTVMHICSFAAIERGLLAFVPDDFPEEKEPYPVSSYLITEADLMNVKKCPVELAVISSGHSWVMPSLETKMTLPSLLLSAGVKSVVYSTWSVPDSVLQTFFYHFYMSLQSSSTVSRALYLAKLQTKESYTQAKFWNAFTMAGEDVTIDLSQIRSAQMHQELGKQEKDSVLMTPLLITEERTPELCHHELQVCTARVSGCLNSSNASEVLGFLLGILEEATDRLANDDNAGKPVVILPDVVLSSKGTVEFLQLLGFDLQSVSKGILPIASSSVRPNDLMGDAQMIIFPHWNQDSLLLPAHRLLTGLLELSTSQEILHAVANLLPLSQTHLCMVIDLLAVLHHSPEMQLRTTDLAVQQLWKHNDVRSFLHLIGVTSVRDLVIFQRSLTNRAMVIGSLQLLVSLSLHRNHEILDRLNISSLGQAPSSEKLSRHTLYSLDPIVMPRNEIFIRSAWMKDDTHLKENKARKELAKKITETNDRFTRTIDHTKWWHRSVVIPRKLENQELVPPPTPQEKERQPIIKKVKVKSGATPSCTRVVLNENKQPALEIHETLKKREEARSILHKRCEDLEQRFASSIRSSYLPYAQTPRKDS